MPKSYRNTWGKAVAVPERTRRLDDRSIYVFTHDFELKNLPSICEAMRRANRRVIYVEAREGVMVLAVRHRDISPRKGECHKKYLKRTAAEDASVVGDAFGAAGRYVERTVGSGNGRRFDRQKSFKPIPSPVIV